MLKSVVQNEPFCPIFRQGESCVVTIFAYAKLSATIEALAQQGDFVRNGLIIGIAFSKASITTRENGGAMTFGSQPLCNPKHHGRFARAADRQVSNTDHG